MAFEHRGWAVGRIGLPSLLAGLAILLAVAASPAQAAFPGSNGKFLFVRSAEDYTDYRLHVLNPDGTATLIGGEGMDSLSDPEWSPDGTKIVYDSPGHGFTIADASGTTLSTVRGTGTYVDNPSWTHDGRIVYDFSVIECEVFQCYPTNWGIRVMNADGTNDVQITFEGTEPAWSPNGDKVAFVKSDAIHVANADGSNERRLTSDSTSYSFWGSPAWSPDGKKLVFNNRVFPTHIWTINADGSGLTQLTSGDHFDGNADWSPDGTRIAFTREGALLTIRPDGTNLTWRTFTGHDGHPTWQPLRPPGYARPVSATPLVVRLVPAHVACSSQGPPLDLPPNSSHGAPLDLPACNPPVQASDHLTAGTPDANGKAAGSTGHLSLRVLTEHPIDLTNGDQSDVSLTGQITDVRHKGTLADYTGELRASVGLRLTDRLNSPAGGAGAVHPATVSDASFGFSFACAATPSEAVGSTCSVATTADAVAPGVTPEGKRAIWELGQVEVYDGGSDGDGDTTGDNTLFAVQGLFAP